MSGNELPEDEFPDDHIITRVRNIGKGKRLPWELRGELTKELKRRYKKGASVRELADLTHRSYGGICNILREAGVVLRVQGGGLRGEELQQFAENLKEEYESTGATERELAKKYGRSQGSINRLLTKVGTTKRSRGTRNPK